MDEVKIISNDLSLSNSKHNNNKIKNEETNPKLLTVAMLSWKHNYHCLEVIKEDIFKIYNNLNKIEDIGNYFSQFNIKFLDQYN